jgi:hypothetical protein
MIGFDYSGWAARAREFTQQLAARPGATVEAIEIEAPAASTEVARAERLQRTPLPEALRALYELGAQGINCRYTYDPDPDDDIFIALFPTETGLYGGAQLDRLENLADNQRSVREWARDTWIATEPRERAVWESALPFHRLQNGDFLALDRRENSPDPVVLYLAHDEESFELAPHFTEFLLAWENLCYLGPEAWLLSPFRGPDGRIDATGARALDLRRMLGEPRAPAV